MSKSNRYERAPDEHCAGPGQQTRSRAGAAVAAALLLALAPSFEALGSDARRAIEELEGCSSAERAKGNCINILKRESAGKGKQRIKAQVRGGRIIWYEYDSKSGRVRRAN